MSEPLCPHCLQPLRGRYEGNCPHCGRSLENRNPEGALPLGTQLAGRYTIGTYLSADGDGLAYRGILNEEKKFVLIKEYFPVTLCNGPKRGKKCCSRPAGWTLRICTTICITSPRPPA